MDPISAISLASNVIQFVDFGCKLISQSRQLYKSADANATLSDKIHVEVITQDLISLMTNLHSSLPHTPLYDLDEGKEGSWDDERGLIDLSERCQELAQQLMSQLNKLKVRSGLTHKSWEAFKAALRSSWKREETELLATQLFEIRAEIEFRVLLNFRKSIKTIVHQQSQTSHQLTNCTQSIITTFLQCRDELAIELQKQAEKLASIQGYQERVVLEKHGTFQTLRHQDDEDEWPHKERHITANDILLEREMVLLMVENAILGSLEFASIRDRQEDLEPAHHQTFQWVYKESIPGGERDRSNFVEWLQKDIGYYWISGKAGSGKSTLMKYICNNRETQRQLRNWAGSSEYHMSSYFFWNSGTDDQRSQKGLLRTLLYETLQTHRELIPKVFPIGWEYWSAKVKTALKLKTVPSKSSLLSHQSKSSSLSELKRAFKTLIRECQKRDVKLCFFVDGLDEYESSPFEGDHDDLAEYFLGFSHEPGLKMCLSSRPLIVFEETFTGPGLKLQNLTRGDISHYVEDKLANHRHMQRLSITNPGQARSLVREIVNKASGVFLWVRLVVRSLLQGLRDSNRVSDLQKRLKHLPADLEALYGHMLRKIDPFYLEQASQIFQVVLTAQRESSKHQITLLQLSWAEDEDEQLAITASLQCLSNEQIISRCKLMDSRLKSVCSGFLESYESKYSNIAPDARVVCMHRTVSDFFKKPSVWEEIVKHTAGTKFCSHLSLLRSSVLQLKSLKAGRFIPMDMSIVRDALHYAKRAEDDLGEGFPALLDQLDAAASYQWRLSNGRCIFGRAEQSADVEAGEGRITAPLDISPPHDRIDVSSSAESDYYDCRSSGEYDKDISQATPKAKQITIGSPPPHKPSGLSISLWRTYKPTQRIEIDNVERSRDLSVLNGVTVPGLPHWTYGIEILGVKLYHHTVTFYDLATLLGLRHYLADKNISGLVVDHDVNHHLLIYHVGKYTRPKKLGESQVPDPTTVQLALEAGADPNLSFHGDSAWEVVLAGILSHLSRFEFDEELWNTSSSASHTWKSESKTWSEVMKIFLQHGANPVASSKQYFGQPRRKPLAIIRLLPPSLVSEADELGRLINQMIEKQNPKALGVVQEEKSHHRSKSEPQRNSSHTISWVFSWFGIQQKETE